MNQQAADDVAERTTLSWRRRWAYRFILLVVIPLGLLAITEGALRLVGVGYRTSLFVRIPGADAYTTNPNFGRRFFSRALNRAPLPPHMPAKKGPTTYRVFVLGGSAAQGVPDPSVGFGRMLQVMLAQTYPDARFEVINAAMTAVNSYVVLPVTRNCARFEPDLFIVYVGNNEVTGPFGTGTVFGRGAMSLGMIRAQLAMKTTRLGQCVDGLTRRLAQGKGPAYWSGMEMFLDNQVGFDDPGLVRTYAHLRRNLSDICGVARAAGAEVIVSTVAVNLVDCPPFASAPHDGAGDAFRQAEDFPNAIAAYQRALETHPDSAELHYRLGQCFLATDRLAEASAAFAAARDQDRLRFRADSAINDVIRDVAGQWQGRGVFLVDAGRHLGRAGQAVLPGNDLFYEHVHLTVEGNYQLARLMFPQIVQGLPESIRSQAPASPAPPTQADCLARLALTEWQRLQSISYILSLMAQPPFTTQLNNGARRKRLQRQLDHLQQGLTPQTVAAMTQQYRDAIKLAEDDLPLRTNFLQFLQFAGDLPEARAQAQRLLDALPTNAAAHFEMGMICFGLGQTAAAQTHFQRTAELAPDRASAYAKIAEFMLERRELDQAESYCRKSLAAQPDSPKMLRAMGWIHLARQQWPEAVQALTRAIELRPGKAQMHHDLGLALRGAGRAADSLEQFRKALELDPALLTARKHCAEALTAQGRPAEAVRLFARGVRAMPEDVPLRIEYGLILISANNDADAAAQFRQVLARAPESVVAMNNLAWVLATSPDPATRNVIEAMTIATRAAEQTQRRQPETLDVLAVVQAENGQVDDAVRTVQEAIDLLDPARQVHQLRGYQARLALYKSGGRVSEHRQR